MGRDIDLKFNVHIDIAFEYTAKNSRHFFTADPVLIHKPIFLNLEKSKSMKFPWTDNNFLFGDRVRYRFKI